MNSLPLNLYDSIVPIFNWVRSAVPDQFPVYLVGGAVRDLLLARDVHDLDFVVPKNGLGVARAVADKMGAAFYPLDIGRETGRVIWLESSGKRWNLDFAIYRNSDLEGDLAARDLTINAIAMDIRQPTKLIDPLDGVADLRAKQIRSCTPISFQTDPVRILRAVRFATTNSFQILPDTVRRMKAAVAELNSVSPERLRDEFFRILDSDEPSKSLHVLDRIGGLMVVFPELEPLRGLAQSPPHVEDVWEHTRDVIARLEQVLSALSGEYDPESASNLYTGMVALRLGRYRQQIQSTLMRELSERRTVRSLLFFAALYHDVGKKEAQRIDETGRIRFFEHEDVGAEMISRRGQWLHLSNIEVSWLTRTVRYHLRPILLAQDDRQPTRRATYRFFRDAQDAGVEVCLLSLADCWGTYGVEMPQSIWARQIEVVRSLLETYWENPAEIISPPIFITGHDLITEFSLQPGPVIGKLLEQIREAGAAGLIHDRLQALSLARSILEGAEYPESEE